MLVYVDGIPFAVLPDTGSSNFNLATARCGTKCDVHPLWSFKKEGGATFEITYGTGGAVMTLADATLSFGGVTVQDGSVSAIVDQLAGSDGFNLFPARDDPVCYNTYAGVLGLAYRRQAAGPAIGGKPNSVTNGTSMPLFDQLVAGGTPNAFAIEVCGRYPTDCGPRLNISSWLPSRSCDVNYNVGNFYIGGYRSSSLAETMAYTPISDEIHMNVIFKGIQVCGVEGCKNVSFPDQIGGATESSCHCHDDNQDCAIPLDQDEYCYFTAIDSGADGIFMNTVGNVRALLNTMDEVGMVEFPEESDNKSRRQQFYFDVLPIPGAKASEKSRFTIWFPGLDGEDFGVDVDTRAIFRHAHSGLVQIGVHGNLTVAASYQSAKFPVLLGDTIMYNRVVFFDRSRKRIGFAKVKKERCGEPVSDPEAEIDRRGLVVETPGTGCRRGTGSGGGCPQKTKPSRYVKRKTVV